MKRDRLIEFMKTYHEDVLEAFERFERKRTYPSIGTKVATLVPGYGGRGGEIRYVVGYSDSYIELSPVHGGPTRFLADKDTWWKELSIMFEPDPQ